MFFILYGILVLCGIFIGCVYMLVCVVFDVLYYLVDEDKVDVEVECLCSVCVIVCIELVVFKCDLFIDVFEEMGVFFDVYVMILDDVLFL